MSDLLSNAGGFATGFGQGLWGGAKGMVQGLGNLAEGAYGLATDPNARAQAWNDAVNAAQTVEWAAQNPGQAADAVGQGASNLYNNFVTAEQQAVANGQGAQFWGNVAGQGAFAAGTVLVPGLAEGKLAGAAGELGEAGRLADAAGTLGDAVPALDEAATVLPDPGALSFVPENAGPAQSPAGQVWRDYQSQTLGSDMDPLTGQSNVPALQFDNPNPNGNPYVKWDGYQFLPDGTTELIDAKTAISPFSTDEGPFVPPSTYKQFSNMSSTLAQNPGYSGVIEVPTDQVAADAQTALTDLGVTNLGVRVRPFQDPAAAVPEAAVPDALAPDAGLLDATGSTLGTDATNPGASATAFPNTGNLLGLGLLGGGALGNLLSDPTPTATTSDTTQLFPATDGVNPDGSLTTLSSPAQLGPVAPPQTEPTTPVSTDTAPATPPPAPVDTAPATPPLLSAPIDLTPPLPTPPPPAPVDITPVIPPPSDPTIDSADPAIDDSGLGTSSDSIIGADPTDDLAGDSSAIAGGGDGGGMDDMAAMDFSC